MRADVPGLDVVCVGESMVVLTPEPLGSLRGAETLRRGLGGAESNVAGYLAPLGVRVAWAGRVGADPFGAFVHESIAASGVDCRWVVTDPEAPTGIYFKDPGRGVHYYRRGSAASRLGPPLWNVISAGTPRWVHLTGITPALSDSCRSLVETALHRRAVPGAAVSFDVNYRPALWSPDTAAPVLRDLASRADLVLVGLDEAQALWGCATAEDVRALLPEPPTLVVKDGAVGATAFDAGGPTFVPANAVDVVEPVGAGDAFAAGYLFGTLRNVPQEARLRLGHALAGVALRTTGDVGAAPPADALLAAAGISTPS
ncbi:carbohydrate kinase [Virgisporangium aliadipatigenens]|uniref:Carbohydrate kinase n=1 Tax=Virgisporangium aliadipatigenens TaxID=741659 RepID=A0A8J3YJY6_9ACTN|nr:sugar kinase [Virgisporangium aliadipatigenens]GIJ46546.1 carbohydrate kinase [Virgisporangium aliadipatigenens]